MSSFVHLYQLLLQWATDPTEPQRQQDGGEVGGTMCGVLRYVPFTLMCSFA